MDSLAHKLTDRAYDWIINFGLNVWAKAYGFQDTKLSFQEKSIKDIKTPGIKLPGMS